MENLKENSKLLSPQIQFFHSLYEAFCQIEIQYCNITGIIIDTNEKRFDLSHIIKMMEKISFSA